MKRLIIDHPDDMSPDFALHLVQRVAMEGRISKHSTGDHFCWVTCFHDEATGKGHRVITRQRKKGQTSDSFIVENA